MFNPSALLDVSQVAYGLPGRDLVDVQPIVTVMVLAIVASARILWRMTR